MDWSTTVTTGSPGSPGSRAASSGGQEVVLSGRLTIRSLPVARELLHSAVAAGTGDLVVDVTAVEVCDTTGIGMLLGAHRSAAERGRRMVVVGAQPMVLRAVHRLRLHRVLHLRAAPVPA